MNPLVTIVVPTRNSGKTLQACLDSIKTQSYRNIETIVVDNYSQDDTAQIAGSQAHKFLQAGPERSAQRNLGAREASGEYLLFPDSDMVIGHDVVKQCVEKAAGNPSVRGIVIPEESFGTGFWSNCRRLERLFYKGVDWLEAARFFRREDFLKMGGYDTRNTGTEDFDLPQRMKAEHGPGCISRITDHFYHDEQKRKLFEACKTNYYYGHGLDAYISVEANRENFRKQYSVVQRYKLFFSNPAMLFRNPILGLGVLFMKLCEFGSWGAGFMTARLEQVLRKVRGGA
jgi:glycosyltransferase involved in cell wall biosynthesis